MRWVDGGLSGEVRPGRANRDASTADVGYWVERNFAAVEDRQHPGAGLPGWRAELAADAELAALHARAVAWRKERFRRLMNEEPWRAFFGRRC